MTYLGIDPGLEGAIAVLNADGSFMEVRDLPTVVAGKGKRDYDIPALHRALGELSMVGSRVIIERVHAMPKQGVTSMFNFGRGLGILEALLVAHKLSYSWAIPNQWKKVMGFGPLDGKEAARLKAQQLYPTAELHLKKHVGRADALLIAEYGRTKHQGSISRP